MNEQKLRTSKSKFAKVKTECGNEQIIFLNATSEVKCLVSGDVIAKPTGGRIQLIEGKAKILQEFD
ncbi:MAG: 30S ribosomal protein S27e [Candidatus Micrarchaeia archaeon]